MYDSNMSVAINKLYYNTRALALKSMAFGLRLMPFRVSLISLLGFMLGLANMFFSFKHWRAVTRFASLVDARPPAILYVPRYYIQRAKDRLWTELLFEAPKELLHYIKIEGACPLGASCKRRNRSDNHRRAHRASL